MTVDQWTIGHNLDRGDQPCDGPILSAALLEPLVYHA
jgi:hypothetical protein